MIAASRAYDLLRPAAASAMGAIGIEGPM
jgi:hypothetical protein